MTPDTIVIIAVALPWDHKRSNGSQRLRWDAFDSVSGDQLAEHTDYPFYDACHSLVIRGANPESLVTMYHEGSEVPSFKPIPLRVPAKLGAKRAAAREAARGRLVAL